MKNLMVNEILHFIVCKTTLECVPPIKSDYSLYVITTFSVGLPVPIVAISAGISHDHYGSNDRCEILMHVQTVLLYIH